MIFSDFASPTVSTSADTAGTTANITYNGVGGKVLGVWGTGGAQTATAAQAIKLYALFSGNGVPGVQPNIPISSWRSGYLAGASVGSIKAGPSFFPVNWTASAGQAVTIDVRNAASSTAPLAQVGLLYGTEQLPKEWALLQSPWNLRDIPSTCMTATPTSVITTTEAGVGTITIPNDYHTVVGHTVLGATNGVRVTAEEFFGTARITATGVRGGQFEPAQKWPFFGQQDAPVGTDIQDESFMPEWWYPQILDCAPSSTLQALVTLRTAISNADSFQYFVAVK